jgi:outer membrane protein insertion porin family
MKIAKINITGYHSKLIKILLAGFVLTTFGMAQSPLKIIYVEKVKIEFNPKLRLNTSKIEKTFINRVYSPVLLDEVKETVDQYLKENGYFFSKIDSSTMNIDNQRRRASLSLTINPGKPLRLNMVSVESVDSFSSHLQEELIEIVSGYQINIDTRNMVDKLYRSILEYFEEGGYPLARIETKDMKFEEDKNENILIDLFLSIQIGDSVNISYLRFPNGTSNSIPYFRKKLRFKASEPYQYSKVSRYNQILSKEEFIKSVEAPILAKDENGQYFIEINYAENPSTTFDGILGYIPPPVNSTTENGYFTGLVNVGVRNLFGTGRKLHIFWQKQDRYSDEFSLSYKEPFILGLPFHTALGINRLLRDTTYLEWKYHFKFELPLNESLSAFVTFTGREVTPDSLASHRLRLPQTSSFFTETGILWDLRDNLKNPRKGVFLDISFSFGRQKNNGPLYLIMEDSLNTSETLQKVGAEFSFFLPTFKQQVFANRIHAEIIANSTGIVRTPDQIWFGGATTLRGYREAQFSGERVIWINSEYRILLGPLTRLFGFVDNGYFLKKFPEESSDYLTGYGLGVRLTAPIGLLQIDFGLEEGAPFREGKIHISLINEF